MNLLICPNITDKVLISKIYAQKFIYFFTSYLTMYKITVAYTLIDYPSAKKIFKVFKTAHIS